MIKFRENPRFFYEEGRKVHSLGGVKRRISVAFTTEAGENGSEIVRYGAAIWRPSEKPKTAKIEFASRSERRQAFEAGKIPKAARDVWSRRAGKAHALDRLQKSPEEFVLTGNPVRLSDVIKAIHDRIAENHPYVYEKVKPSADSEAEST